MTHRTTLERLATFVLGGVAFFAGAATSGGLGALAAILVALAVVCGLVEAASVRRTGQRHRVMSWLPAILGMIVLAAVTIATGPQGPDSGLALSIVAAAFAVIVPVFAVLVLIVAAIALHAQPPPPVQ